MASLTGNLVAETYKALLKTIDNDILTASEKQITDGFGGGSNVFIDSNGFLIEKAWDLDTNHANSIYGRALIDQLIVK
jgi:hypothetical protein